MKVETQWKERTHSPTVSCVFAAGPVAPPAYTRLIVSASVVFVFRMVAAGDTLTVGSEERLRPCLRFYRNPKGSYCAILK